MEEHPIPQNVTDFEFHLVGDMSLKQFGYLAAGLTSAYIIFVVFGKSAPFVSYPVVAILAITGAAFAFLPIGQRPLDHWLAAFLKAIFQPTQRSFKSDLIRVEDPFFKKRLAIYIGLLTQPEGLIPNLPPPVSQPVSRPPTPQAIPKTPVKAEEKLPPSSDELKKTVDLAKEAQTLQDKILETEKRLSQIKSSAAIQGADPKTFAQKFQDVLNELQKLNQEAQDVSGKLATLSKTPLPKPTITTSVKARTIPTLTLTSVENIINGIVTDSLGNYIEGAIVVAHDKKGLPVRALKSNKLGQFIAATPLPPGTYTLTIEKDTLLFDATEVELSGTVLKPVMISAKKPERETVLSS